MHCVFGVEYSCFFRSPRDCFDELLHPFLKIFYQASITCNLVVEGDFMQASHRASQITSVDDGHRHRQGLCMIRSRTPQLRALAPVEMFNISHAGKKPNQWNLTHDLESVCFNIKQASKTQETSKKQEIMKSYAAAVRPDSVAEE